MEESGTGPFRVENGDTVLPEDLIPVRDAILAEHA